MGAKVDIVLDAQTGKARRELEGFLNWMKAGFGMEIARRATEFLSRIPAMFAAAVRRGVEFNSMIEDTQIAMAALLRQLSPEAFGDFGQAMDGAKRLIAGLREEAARTKATFGELVGATQGLIGPALSAGIPVERIPALSSMVARTVSTAMPGAPAFQIMQEGRALLTGQIGPDAQVARTLGITREMITTARAQGRLFELLEERMSAFNEAAEASMGTLSGLTSNLSDALSDALAEATKDLYEEVKAFVGTIKEIIASEEFKTAVKEFGQSLMAITQGLVQAAQWLGPVVRVWNQATNWLSDVFTPVFRSWYDRTSDPFSDPYGSPSAANPDASPWMNQDGATVSGGARTTRPARVRPPLLAPESRGDSRSGLWLTRAQAVVASRSLEVQRRMLDQLGIIAQALTQRGIKVVALDIPV